MFNIKDNKKENNNDNDPHLQRRWRRYNGLEKKTKINSMTYESERVLQLVHGVLVVDCVVHQVLLHLLLAREDLENHEKEKERERLTRARRRCCCRLLERSAAAHKNGGEGGREGGRKRIWPI